MEQATLSTARREAGGYVVGLPRATDAMATALRCAFAGDATLPADLRACIVALDRQPGTA